MTKFSNDKHGFDLEKRTTEYAKEVVKMCRMLPRDPINDRLTGQVVGASGSVGANYREANDSLGKKDFINRLKVSRKESKEAIHWLELIIVANPGFEKAVLVLIKESNELKNILSSIIAKCE